MKVSTTRTWKVDESCLFQGVLFIFAVQYAFGLGVFFLSTLSSALVGVHKSDGSWFSGVSIGLNTLIFVTLVASLRLQERRYEIDDTEEVMRIVNWLPLRRLAVSVAHPLGLLLDVEQVMHKGEACVRVVFAKVSPSGHESTAVHFLFPEEQEDLVRALSAYLPQDHPNRGIDGVAWVIGTDESETACARPLWPWSLVMSRQPPLLAVTAAEATWGVVKTWMGASLVWAALQVLLIWVIKSSNLSAHTQFCLWVAHVVLCTVVCLVAIGLWNMGNAAEFRIHEAKLQVASSRPFVCTEDYDLKYMHSVSLVPGSRLLQEREPGVSASAAIVMGELPSTDALQRAEVLVARRKRGLLSLILVPEDQPARFADVLAHQIAHHQMML